MSTVGAFPTLKELNLRTVRGPTNPLDKSTLISIYPRPIKFKNVTLTPGRWFLDAGSVEDPAILVVGPSSWFRQVSFDEPLIEIIQFSTQIAKSLIDDYLNGLFACNMGDTMPGLFWIPGAFTKEQVMASEDKGGYRHLLAEALQKQTNYYRTLIRFGDALWARSNGNPLVINDEMRMAAKTLGQMDRDWMRDHTNIGQVRCFACGSFKHPDFAICQSCHTADPNHPRFQEVMAARASFINQNQIPQTQSAVFPNLNKAEK